METQPLISVITVVYNGVKTLEQTIQSVLNQSYKNIEYIIIDGGSTDGTLDIIKKYHHLKWLSEHDNGQSDALNKGFKKAKGNWIIWLNADDILLPNAIKKYYEVILKKPDTDVIHGHVYFFRDNLNKIFKYQYFSKFKHINTIFRIVTPPSTGTLFKASTLKNNPLREDFHYMMDSEWFMRCGKNLKVVNINDFLIKFRISGFNKTANQILNGTLNEQQIREQDILYNIYFLPLIDHFPKIFYKHIFKTLHYILLTINRIQKLKFVVLEKFKFYNLKNYE